MLAVLNGRHSLGTCILCSQTSQRGVIGNELLSSAVSLTAHSPTIFDGLSNRYLLVKTLKSVTGKYMVLETTRGRLEGNVVDCKPDYVILQCRDKNFFVRICEIVWIMPE